MKYINEASAEAKQAAEKILRLDAGSVWGVGLDTGGKKTGAESSTRIEVCFDEQKDGSPAGYAFIQRGSIDEEGIIDNNFSWF